MYQLKGYDGISIGAGQPLLVMAGLNVLEDEGLALEVAAELKQICSDLSLPYVFKASFDKANRSSITSYRGPGQADGLAMLASVKAAHGLPVVTDIHTPEQADAVAEIAEIVQLPAFLVRQTDLPVILCERGSSFGYNNLTVDMLAIPEMHKLGVPVTIDATHAVQLPGADPRTAGASTGGRRDGVPVLAKAAVAAGADGVFLEFHPRPDEALCDAPSCLPLDTARALLSTLKDLHTIVQG
jgi:2-dehydro-3-deoxyphosphooctonate aldolase (KDO 8-P synthase)